MAEQSGPEEFEVLEVIPLHFKVPEHHLPLREFIETAKNTEAIVEAFNSELFGGRIRYEIIVLPPQAGTFKNRLGLHITSAYVGAALAASWTGLESDMGKAFILGLTGHEPAFWTEQAGQSLKEALKEDADQIQKVQSKCAALVLSEATKGFLSKGTDELRSIGVTKDKFRDAYNARNEFYHACVRNGSIQGVGFDDSDQFPIERKVFADFIVSLPPIAEEEPEHDWKVEATFLKVTSPNWDREDAKRTWKGKDSAGRAIFFVIEDDNFWGHVQIDKLSLHAVDQLKVQWAYLDESGRRKQIRILRVLEFNGTSVSSPIADDDLPAVLSLYTLREDHQADLFDD